MRKYSIILSLVLFVQVPCFAWMDLVTKPFEYAADKAKDARDALFQETMIAKTIESIAQIKKNYEEATALKNEIKQYQDNPQRLFDESYEAFKRGWGDPEADLKARIAAKEPEKGVLQKFHDAALEKELRWIDKNITIAEWTREKVEEHNKALKQAAEDLKSTDKNTVDTAKNMLTLIMANALVNQERLFADFLKANGEQQKHNLTVRVDITNNQNALAGAINNIYSNMGKNYYSGNGDRSAELLKRIKEIPSNRR